LGFPLFRGISCENNELTKGIRDNAEGENIKYSEGTRDSISEQELPRNRNMNGIHRVDPSTQ
jgi:hypothetical protein